MDMFQSVARNETFVAGISHRQTSNPMNSDDNIVWATYVLMSHIKMLIKMTNKHYARKLLLLLRCFRWYFPFTSELVYCLLSAAAVAVWPTLGENNGVCE